MQGGSRLLVRSDNIEGEQQPVFGHITRLGRGCQASAKPRRPRNGQGPRLDGGLGSNVDQMVRLVGQLSNLSPRLQSILDLSGNRVKSRATQPQSQPAQRRLGNGVVQRAVMQVLGDADGPMRTGEVQAGVERLLGRPVAKESVSWSLRTGSCGAKPRFECVAYATYRLRPPS